jgi:uncharacterized protein (TIGR02391 family)
LHVAVERQESLCGLDIINGIMIEKIEQLLHPRIVKRCVPRYRDGYYKDAAAEAMTQVEQALKESSGVTGYGVHLIKSVLGKGNGIKLRVPFGAHMQEPAQRFFEGAFSYYRNYAVHEGDRIGDVESLRVMILASELLELIGASRLSFADLGGEDGLISQGIFASLESLYQMLCFLDGHTLPDEVCDGFYEELYEQGFSETQLQALSDLGFVEYSVQTASNSELGVDNVGHFGLTVLGRTTEARLAIRCDPSKY